MAEIDVTNNGVTFNDASSTTAQANASAIETILTSQANDGDTVLFPFTAGDICYIEADVDNDVERIINTDVSGGLAQNLIVKGQVDQDDTSSTYQEPLGRIKVPDSQNNGGYMWEIETGAGLDLTVRDLRFDANSRGSTNDNLPLFFRDQSAGAVNDILLENVDLYNGGGVNIRIRVNGVTMRGCTTRDATVNHGITVAHQYISEADANAAPVVVEDTLSKNNTNGNGLNASPGRVDVKNFVSLNNESAFKGGNENSNSGLATNYENVRAEGFTARGYDTVFQTTPSTQSRSTWTNVILDGSGMTTDDDLIDIDSNHEVYAPADSTVLLLNSDNAAITLRQSGSAVNVDGEIQICGSDAEPLVFRLNADANIVWDTYRHANNGDESITNFSENGASLTVNTEETTACQTDIASVPTASEVGIGTASSGGGTTRSTDGSLQRSSGSAVRSGASAVR